MSARAGVKKFDEKHMNESFEHARELKFADDFESTPNEDDKFSKTANFFGDFYFTGETTGAKALASKVVNQELKEMRERLNWGTLTSTKQIPKEEFQNQLSKSRFLSLFLVMRRVTGRFQLNQKKKAFRNWVEWYKHYMVLFRSRPVARSRSGSPNSSFRSVRFNGQSDAGSVSTHSTSTHHHPHNYHFHGERNMSPQQLRKELYLHRDIFLTSADDDAQQALLHHVHPHASNHPEMETKLRFASPKMRASLKPDIKHAKAMVPSHIVRKVSAHRASPNQPPSPASTVHSNVPQNGYHFHGGDKNKSAKQLKKELYLHHDLFLTSEDDAVAQALLHKAHPHSPNHPELEYKPHGLGFNNHPGSQRNSPTQVPSHVVPKRSPSSEKNAALRARSLSPTRSAAVTGRELSPQQLRKDAHLHHDMFLTSQDDDIAQTMMYRAHPHSPNTEAAAELSRFASPKRRAAARLEAEKRAAALAKVPSHVVQHRAVAARSASPSGGRSEAASLHSEESGVSQVSKGGAEGQQAKRITCRHLDTIAGSRKDAHALHKADPASHVKAIAAGKLHSNITAKPITPSLYSSGVTSAGLKPFNVSKDKKHDPKPKLSHSPSRVLPMEHAETVGIKMDHEELRPGSPTRTLARALSILVTPASDAVKHDHRAKPHHVLGRTLTALSITGHESIVGAVVASPNSPTEDNADSESSYDTDSDEEVEELNPEGGVRQNSRLSGMNLTRGLSICTDMGKDGTASVASSSQSPSRRNSFHAPTVSHILKLAHRSDSVEKVASKVKEKRSKVKQTLPKSPHPSQTFPIIPDELIAKRAERRTSFRSPTKSHAIKVVAKLGLDDGISVAGSTNSMNKPERRKSFADSMERDSSANVENGLYSIRTIIPFTGMNNNHGASASALIATSSPAAASPSIYGSSPGKLVRRGSTVGSLGPQNFSPNKTGGGTGNTGTGTPNSGGNKGGAGSGNNKASFQGAAVGVTFEDNGDDASSVVGDDDASVCVYNVDDDLINLFDPTSPKFKKTGNTPKNNSYKSGSGAKGGVNGTASPAMSSATKAATPKYKPGTPKHAAMLKKQADEQKTAALNVVFGHLDTLHGRVGKTTSRKVAFNTWRAANNWFKKVDERVPQSIMYLLQVEQVKNYLCVSVYISVSMRK